MFRTFVKKSNYVHLHVQMYLESKHIQVYVFTKKKKKTMGVHLLVRFEQNTFKLSNMYLYIFIKKIKLKTFKKSSN